MTGIREDRARKLVPLKSKPAKKAKAPQRSLEHRVFGLGCVVGIYATAAGCAVADVQFNDGKRTLSLQQAYWISDIADLLALTPERRPLAKPEPKPEPVDDDVEKDGDTAELQLDSGAHFAERGDADSEEGLESEDSERADMEEVLA
jgi:hypothetical protein